MAGRGREQDAGGGRRGLALILLLAALIRLPLALFTPGYDVLAYRLWARVVHTAGIGGAYGAAYPDVPGSAPYHYQPFYLYVLRATGLVYAALRPGGGWDDQLLTALLKCSPVAAELALGVVIWRFLRDRVGSGDALAATAVYLLTPGLIWNTAYWGGIDAFQALFLTLGLCATVGGATAPAWPLAALAVGTKITALPGALALGPAALRAARPRSLLLAAVATLGTVLMLTAPILLAGQLGAMRRGMFDTLGIYALTSFNTHNFWWLAVGGNRPDTGPTALGLDYRQAGRLLFILAAVPALVALWRAPADTPRLFATSAYLSFAFAMLTTGVHENWAYVACAPLLIAAALDPAYRPLYAAFALTFLLNLWLEDPPFHRLIADWSTVRAAVRGLRTANAVGQCLMLVWWGWLLLRPARGALAVSGRRARAADQAPS